MVPYLVCEFTLIVGVDTTSPTTSEGRDHLSTRGQNHCSFAALGGFLRLAPTIQLDEPIQDSTRTSLSNPRSQDHISTSTSQPQARTGRTPSTYELQLPQPRSTCWTCQSRSPNHLHTPSSLDRTLRSRPRRTNPNKGSRTVTYTVRGRCQQSYL